MLSSTSAACPEAALTFNLKYTESPDNIGI